MYDPKTGAVVGQGQQVPVQGSYAQAPVATAAPVQAQVVGVAPPVGHAGVYQQQQNNQYASTYGQQQHVVYSPQGQFVVHQATDQRRIIGYEMTPEAWCWVCILIFLFWPLAWIPCVCDGCKRPIYAAHPQQVVVTTTQVGNNGVVQAVY